MGKLKDRMEQDLKFRGLLCEHAINSKNVEVGGEVDAPTRPVDEGDGAAPVAVAADEAPIELATREVVAKLRDDGARAAARTSEASTRVAARAHRGW
jgi:hypothetical protein